ncbi:MAG: tRNA-dihydrouridine synthase family protein [Legionellales bacterium]|nr:tRNA-dihydrouridine synthase family protein [Legionellales bacterium]
MTISSLKLGKKNFPVNLIQAPLAGVSCAPFRALTWQYSQPAFSCTEMLSCKTLLHQSKVSQSRYLAKDPAEGPVCVQLSGNNPLELAEAVKRVSQYGADLIDLNCGCPVPKIRSKGAGSSLLIDPSRLYQLIHAMKQNTHLPVSIKIRVEGGSQDRFHEEIARVVSDAGADFLVVHGRHWTEHYETPCHYDDIQFFVEALNIPVIGNGDVACIISLKRMFATGCAGAMIGRAGVGQPWLIAQLRAEMAGDTFTAPDLPEIGDIFLTHVRKLMLLLNSEKFAILQARKLAKYYARTMSGKAEFCAKMNECEQMDKLTEICSEYFIG